MLLAACKQREVDERIVLDDAAVVGHRRQADQAAQGLDRRLRAGRPHRPGRQGNRRDRGAARPTCRSAWRPTRSPRPWPPWWPNSAPAGPGDMGKVMGAAKARLAGKADMGHGVGRGQARPGRSEAAHMSDLLPLRAVAPDVCVAPQLTPEAMAEAARAGLPQRRQQPARLRARARPADQRADRGRRPRRRPGVPLPAGGRRLPVARSRSPPSRSCCRNCRARCWRSAARAHARRACSWPRRPA